MWIKYIKFLLPLVLLVGVWGYGQYKYSEGVSETRSAIDREYQVKLNKVLQDNAALIIKQKKQEEGYLDEIFDLQENASEYVADVRTSVKRLYIKSASKCVSNNESDTKDVAAEGRSEVSKDVAERLIRRREEADKLAIKLNMCIDYVKSNYQHINGDK